MARNSRLRGLRDRSVEERRQVVAEGGEISQILSALNPENSLNLQLVDQICLVIAAG
jgi:hypothetical protein